MNQSQAVEIALRAFPKLYYFMPPIEPFDFQITRAKSKGRTKKSKAETIKIKKPLDTILWLIDTLCTEQAANGTAYCSQPELQRLATRWTKTGSFNKEIARLYRAKLIQGRDFEHNRQIREVALTARGQRALDKIKAQRRKFIQLLFDKDKLSPEEIQTIASSIEVTAFATWAIMSSQAHSR